ncbi:hypothetical protein GGG16DRAFT_128226 [Schizophyllum commune]
MRTPAAEVPLAFTHDASDNGSAYHASQSLGRRSHENSDASALISTPESPVKRRRLDTVQMHVPASPHQQGPPTTQTFAYGSLAGSPHTPSRRLARRYLPSPPSKPVKSRKVPVLAKSLKARLEAIARRDPVAKVLLEAGTRKTAPRQDVIVDLEEEMSAKPPVRRVYRARQQKLDLFFWFLEHILDWTYGELLYNSGHGSGNGMASDTQYHKVSRFFAGQLDINHCPSRILEMWFSHAYGAGHSDPDHLYALEPRYTDMRDMRASLTSFAAQAVAQKLEREAEVAIQRESGLCVALGEKKARSREGVVPVRKRRPVENVATNVISTMLFSRSDRANLLPIASGILHFGCLAAFDLYRYHSRIGNMPAYTTIMRAMRRLAEHSAAEALAYGSDPSTLNILRGDNVHNYHQHRDPGIGFENELKTGYYGALYEAEDYIPVSAFSIEEKRRYVDLGKRREVNVEMLINLVDFKHLNTVLALQWVQVLLDYIPELSHLSPSLQSMYSELAAKLPLPVRKTKIHPLGCCSKNEMFYPELRDAHLDMLSQIGQTQEKHDTNLVVAGGDGYTYQRLLEMLDMLQFEGNIIDSLEILHPLLEGWHQEYTGNNEIIETHYGKPLTSDYSTLGHSAAKLGRRRPTDLKKVDYAQGAQLMYLVLDARMLDCWRLLFKADNLFACFSEKKRSNALPSLQDLFNSAKKLTRAYMSLREHENILRGDGIEDLGIPVGDHWDGFIADDSSKDFGLINQGKRAAHLGSKRTKTRKAAPHAHPSNRAIPALESDEFEGDLALANSRTFMRAAAISRESMRATAAGDPGRVYEVTKYQLFQFAGSSCSNYTDYLLEKIVSYEFESSPDLKKALLQLSLVNPSGRANHFCHGDLLQEYFNRLLDAVAQHKGVDYSDRFLREVWSRNIYSVAQLKMESMEALGLDKRSAKHTHPSMDPEIRTLLALYQTHKLHSFRAGRVLDEAEDRERFNKGIDNLQRKKLAKFVSRTARKRGWARRLANSDVQPAVDTGEMTEEVEAEDTHLVGEGEDEAESAEMSSRPEVAFITLSNDRLVMRTVDFDEEAVELLEELENARHLVSDDNEEAEEKELTGSDDTLPSFDDPMLGETDDETS